jgi:hypothetical protein
MSNLQSSAGKPGLAECVDGLPDLSGDEARIAATIEDAAVG